MEEVQLDPGHDFFTKGHIDKGRESETAVRHEGRERERLDGEGGIMGRLVAVVLPVREAYGVRMVDGHHFGHHQQEEHGWSEGLQRESAHTSSNMMPRRTKNFAPGPLYSCVTKASKMKMPVSIQARIAAKNSMTGTLERTRSSLRHHSIGWY